MNSGVSAVVGMNTARLQSPKYFPQNDDTCAEGCVSPLTLYHQATRHYVWFRSWYYFLSTLLLRKLRYQSLIQQTNRRQFPSLFPGLHPLKRSPFHPRSKHSTTTFPPASAVGSRLSSCRYPQSSSALLDSSFLSGVDACFPVRLSPDHPAIPFVWRASDPVWYLGVHSVRALFGYSPGVREWNPLGRENITIHKTDYRCYKKRGRWR